MTEAIEPLPEENILLGLINISPTDWQIFSDVAYDFQVDSKQIVNTGFSTTIDGIEYKVLKETIRDVNGEMLGADDLSKIFVVEIDRNKKQRQLTPDQDPTQDPLRFDYLFNSIWSGIRDLRLEKIKQEAEVLRKKLEDSGMRKKEVRRIVDSYVLDERNDLERELGYIIDPKRSIIFQL